MDDLLYIRPTAEGWGLLVSRCDGVSEITGPIELRPSVYAEVTNLLEGIDDPHGLWCQYFTDHSNYPVLTCATEMGGRFTLWAVTDERAAACAP
jgi:hypothetical protein